jgi:outer membrane protein assembly factor BamB
MLAIAAVCTAGLSACSSSATTGAHTTETSTTHARDHARSGTTSAGPTTSASAARTAWTTYGGSFTRTSVDADDPPLLHAPTAAWTSAAPDGSVYGEPLIYRSGVFIATENDTVYGFSATTGSPLWPPDHLATPAPASSLPCGDITPTVGITSTMVIDPSTGVLFASAETLSSGAVGHYLFAIDTSTGRVLWSRDIDQSWDSAAQLQRAGLAVSDNNVLVGFGGNDGDCGGYNGWVLGVPESGSTKILHYRVPTAREGAIWAPAGITVDSSGNVFVATGNGSARPGQAFDHGNSVIELSPQLDELQYFAPTNWAQDNVDDEDLGSTSPVLLGNGLLFVVGKQTTAYLLNAASLGGISSGAASLGVCLSIGASAYLAPSAYVVCGSQGHIDQVLIGPGSTLHRGWSWASPTGGASSPTIAGGMLWTIDPGASMLYGVDPSSGTTRFSVPLHTGPLAHFVATSAAEGMLVVAGAGGVEAFR